MGNTEKAPSKEVLVLGNTLLYGGIIGFLYFFSTTKRMIDINVFDYAFMAVMGWFITQLKSWARKAAVIIFSIYAIGEFMGIVLLIMASYHSRVSPISFMWRAFWLTFYVAFVALLLKKSVRNQFSKPVQST